MPNSRRSPRLRRRVLPPDVYFLSSAQTATALGVSRATLARWRKVWKRDGVGPGIEPIHLASRVVRYRVDDLRCFPGTFLDRMRARTAATVPNTSVATVAA